MLDEVDRSLIRALSQDGRTSNAALARLVGIAESTCVGRVRSLRERGVIRGVHADIDPAAVGLPVQAMIAVRFAGQARDHIDAFAAEVAGLPGVLATYNISGQDDFLVHVATTSPDDLRSFVLDHLTSRPGVVGAQTSLIFEARRGDLLS